MYALVEISSYSRLNLKLFKEDNVTDFVKKLKYRSLSKFKQN